MHDHAKLSASPGFFSWLGRHEVGLIVTCNSTGETFALGEDANGRPIITMAKFDRAMGVAQHAQGIYLVDKHKIWNLRDRSCVADRDIAGADRVYQPQGAYVTGDLDVHEIAVDCTGRVVFANTAFSCLATLSHENAFEVVWKPSFITSISGDDRCHLNGIGMDSGRVRVVSVFSISDTRKAWRERRRDGGAVIDVASDSVLIEGLSMPHSPRLHADALWVLNSGSGHLHRVDLSNGSHEPVLFFPGFLRGLTFVDGHALVTLSLPEASRIDGLDLLPNIGRANQRAWSGVAIADLDNGCVVEWLDFGSSIPQLFDVVALSRSRRPAIIRHDAPTFEITFD